MEPHQSPISGERDKVISPFSQSEAVIASKKNFPSRLFFIFTLGILLVVASAIGGALVMHYLNNPYRTLEAFPVAKYFDNYQSLAGSKFKAELRVEADLGWKDGAGRLMLFSTADDPRPIAVLIPVTVAKGIYFTKGQTYLIQAEVKEGGLIYADSCEKN
jgi:hypothetical protein